MKLKTFLFAVMISALAFAANAGGSSSHDGHGGMDHSQHQGKLIRTATVEGYTLAYHLIDMKEKMAAMGHDHTMYSEAMENMKSHHLMLYVEGPDGRKIEDAQVGYLVKGPGDETQKAMTMAMTGGFGADLDFTGRGSYSIKVKVVHNGTKLMDEFSHTAE